jgi:hypothetical protein
MYQPIPNPSPVIQPPKSFFTLKSFRQTTFNHQLAFAVVLDSGTRVEVAHYHDFPSSLDETIHPSLQQSVIVHLEFTTFLGAGAVVGTIYADEHEQSEIDDDGTSFTVQILVVDLIFIFRDGRVYDIRRISSELGNSFGGLERRFGLNETCEPFLCLERDDSTFTRIYSDPGVAAFSNGEGEEGIERRWKCDLFRESLSRALHL